MKTILYMATSVDGKTTGPDKDTSWVDEAVVERMDALMMKCGVMVMGRKTYESFGDELPNDMALQVIMTSQENLLKTEMENVIFTNESPLGVIEMLSKKGFKQVMLAGGQELNTSFLKGGALDEIKLIVKPLVLGEGKGLFAESVEAKLELMEVVELDDGSVELRYKIYR